MIQNRALITGASSGIGLALAKVCAQKGHDLVLVARSVDKLEALAQELRLRYAVAVEVLPQDLAQPQAAQKVFDQLWDKNMPIDLLINNAGLGSHGKFLDNDPVRLQEVMQVNMMALTELTQLFGREMVARRQGRIMQIASVASFMPSPYLAVYAATKAYVLSFSEAVAEEWRNTGVSITTVCPGVTQTNFMEGAGLAEENLQKFGTFWMQTASEVAQSAYTATQAGKRVHITGLLNTLSVNSMSLVPRAVRVPATGFLLLFWK
ncbi:MAG: SDR family oxidoreductase [Microscillaceae bacterium]|nr:SDR family oxidoreductase [Microscillaceae bacterium]